MTDNQETNKVVTSEDLKELFLQLGLILQAVPLFVSIEIPSVKAAVTYELGLILGIAVIGFLCGYFLFVKALIHRNSLILLSVLVAIGNVTYFLFDEKASAPEATPLQLILLFVSLFLWGQAIARIASLYVFRRIG